MSLRDRLAAKQRRRAVVPIQVSDPGPDYAKFQGALVALRVAQQREDNQPGEVEGLKATAEAAEAAVNGHFAEVELEALPGPEWEAAMARWSGEKVDWAVALAPLLAESCVDEELRDEQWWAERIADPAWSEGDLDVLRIALLRLNVHAADPIVPKG